MSAAPFIPQLTDDDLCELACECEGNTVQTVVSLIEGVLNRYGHLMDDAATAALNAVAHYHVPQLADTLADLEKTYRGD